MHISNKRTDEVTLRMCKADIRAKITDCRCLRFFSFFLILPKSFQFIVISVVIRLFWLMSHQLSRYLSYLGMLSVDSFVLRQNRSILFL